MLRRLWADIEAAKSSWDNFNGFLIPAYVKSETFMGVKAKAEQNLNWCISATLNIYYLDFKIKLRRQTKVYK